MRPRAAEWMRRLLMKAERDDRRLWRRRGLKLDDPRPGRLPGVVWISDEEADLRVVPGLVISFFTSDEGCECEWKAGKVCIEEEDDDDEDDGDEEMGRSSGALSGREREGAAAVVILLVVFCEDEEEPRGEMGGEREGSRD